MQDSVELVTCYAAVLRAAFFAAAGADCPLAAFFAAQRFFIAILSALRPAAVMPPFGLAILEDVLAGAADASPLIFAHRSF